MERQINKLEEAEKNLQRVFDEMELKRVSIEIFRNMSNLFIIVDLDGKIIFWNENWERVFGFGAPELYKSYLFDFVAPEDKEATLKAFSGVVASDGKTIQKPFRNQYISKDGKRIPLEWAANSPSYGSCIVAQARVLR